MNLFKIIRLFFKKISKNNKNEETISIQIVHEDLMNMFINEETTSAEIVPEDLMTMFREGK